MSDRTRPPLSGPHSVKAAASIGDRLGSGRAVELAKLIWFCGLSRPTWPSGEELAADAGLIHWDSSREVRRAIAQLRGSKMLGRGGPALTEPVDLLIPDRGAMTNLWLTCREVRPRPVTLVTLIVGMYVLAASLDGFSRTAWCRVPGSAAEIRRLVGARARNAFRQRMRDLEDLQLIAYDGDALMLAPTRRWYQADRAIRLVASPGPGVGSARAAHHYSQPFDR